jgi:ATP-dependent protease ClpP protease subunit
MSSNDLKNKKKRSTTVRKTRTPRKKDGQRRSRAALVGLGSVSNDYVIQTATDVFSAMTDEDFFSDAVQHLYFYADVTGANVAKLQHELSEANKSTTADRDIYVSPKPIVLHINSGGGDLNAAMALIALYTRSRTPICAMVDGLSASAATILSVLAPYRVASSSNVLTLIHQYQYQRFSSQKQDALEFDVLQANKHLITQVRRIYQTRTRMKDATIDELMLHDLLLDTRSCLQHGIYDRVLDIDNGAAVRAYQERRTDYASMTLSQLVRKTNWNSFTVDCGGGGVEDDPDVRLEGGIRRLDGMLFFRDDLKPVMYYCSANCHVNMFDWIPIVTRIRAFGVPVFAMTDATVDVWKYLPALFCVKRYMYEHASIVIDVVTSKIMEVRLCDIIKNTHLMHDTLLAMLRKRTRLPSEILGSILDRRFFLDAKDCLKYGLCDEIVPIGFS